MAHLIELRDRLLKVVLGVLLGFIPLFFVANPLYTWLATPLMSRLPAGSSMVAIEVASPFLTPFKLAMVASVFLTMPWTLHQLWGFIAPGLYQHEKKLALPLLVSSVALFYAGGAFAYYVAFPLIFAFLTSTAPEGVAVMTDIARYLDFVLTLFFAFGIAFEVPIATFLMCKVGLTTPEALRQKRPYIIVAAFVVGMLLTPPDIFSQTLLAVPMWLLFEAGLFISARFAVARDDDQPDDGYVEPTDAEMDAELDRIEDQEEAEKAAAQRQALEDEIDLLGDDGASAEPPPKPPTT